MRLWKLCVCVVSSPHPGRKVFVALNRWRSSLVILLTLCWASMAAAQIRSSTNTGTVADATKALVPGATVIVTNQDTNARSELVTNDSGLFTAPCLTAGTYSIE